MCLRWLAPIGILAVIAISGCTQINTPTLPDSTSIQNKTVDFDFQLIASWVNWPTGTGNICDYANSTDNIYSTILQAQLIPSSFVGDRTFSCKVKVDGTARDGITNAHSGQTPWQIFGNIIEDENGKRSGEDITKPHTVEVCCSISELEVNQSTGYNIYTRVISNEVCKTSSVAKLC